MAGTGSSSANTSYFYRTVIDDVMQNAKALCADERVDPSVLTQLQSVRACTAPTISRFVSPPSHSTD